MARDRQLGSPANRLSHSVCGTDKPPDRPHLPCMSRSVRTTELLVHHRGRNLRTVSFYDPGWPSARRSPRGYYLPLPNRCPHSKSVPTIGSVHRLASSKWRDNVFIFSRSHPPAHLEGFCSQLTLSADNPRSSVSMTYSWPNSFQAFLCENWGSGACMSWILRRAWAQQATSFMCPALNPACSTPLKLPRCVWWWMRCFSGVIGLVEGVIPWRSRLGWRTQISIKVVEPTFIASLACRYK